MIFNLFLLSGRSSYHSSSVILSSNVSHFCYRSDYNAPSKPTLVLVGGDIVVTWKPPVAPTGRVTGYEVLANGKVYSVCLTKVNHRWMLKTL